MRKLFMLELVIEGYFDKICDQILDVVLDVILEKDLYVRVVCEVVVIIGFVLVMGEIIIKCYVDILKIVRDIIREIGYICVKYGFDVDICVVIILIDEQLFDIVMGVDKVLEVKLGEMIEDEIEVIGVGDQGMMFGFVCDEMLVLMLMLIYFVYKFVRRFVYVRKEGILLYFCLDGKIQVIVEYEDDRLVRVDIVVVLVQYSLEVIYVQIEVDVIEYVIKFIILEGMFDKNIKIFINLIGRFVIGGFQGDFGLIGRKIIVDIYGGYVCYGGGVFFGKDLIKVDCFVIYVVRYVVKNIVVLGFVKKCEVQVLYVIGVVRLFLIRVDIFGMGKISDEKFVEIIKRVFDL